MVNRLDELKGLPDKDLQRLLTVKDEDGRSMLHSAAGSGHIELVEYLLSRGAARSVEEADDEGWTPLQSAASAGHEEIVRLLLEAGASPNAANTGGRTALHYAASKGRPAILRLLIQKGADLRAKDLTGSTALHRACSAGRAEAVRLLVEEVKIPLEVRDRSGATPLCVAAASGERSISLFLISKGANVEAENKDGETPLSEAARHAGLREAMVTVAKREMKIDA